jgi:hypothetical protein
MACTDISRISHALKLIDRAAQIGIRLIELDIRRYDSRMAFEPYV